jgi:hypothetical protein
VDEHLDALLQAAVEDNDLEAAAMLLKAGANVSVTDLYDMTPLHEAAFAGFADMCRLLLDFGAVWDRLDKYQRTPLHWAAYFGRISAVVAIMNHQGGGGGRSAEALHLQVRRPDYVGDTPEALAGWMGRVAVAKYFRVLCESGLEAAAASAARAIEAEAYDVAHPPPSPLDEALEQYSLDPDTVLEGPEPPDPQQGAEPDRAFNEYVVGPEDGPVVNKVPWGPGTRFPTVGYNQPPNPCYCPSNPYNQPPNPCYRPSNPLYQPPSPAAAPPTPTTS